MTGNAGRRVVAMFIGLVPMSWTMPALAQSAPEGAAGKDVRITLADGARHAGKLVSLTETEVVVRQKTSATNRRYPLSDVTLVETTHHYTRNLAIVGGALGMGIGLAVDWCGTGRPYGSSGPSGEPDCITPGPLLTIGASAAAGALIGASIDRSRRRVLYGSPSTIMRVVPVIRPAGAGVRVVVIW